MSNCDSFDQISLSSTNSWDVLDPTEVPGMDKDIVVDVDNIQHCSICHALFNRSIFKHPHCDTCLICSHCLEESESSSLMNACSCRKPTTDEEDAEKYYTLASEILEYASPPMSVSSCSSSIENVHSVTENEEAQTVAESLKSCEQNQDVKNGSSVRGGKATEVSSIPTSQSSIFDSVVEVIQFDPIEIPKLDLISPILPMVPTELPLINFQACSLSPNLKPRVPTKPWVAANRSRHSPVDSGGNSPSNGGSDPTNSVKTAFKPLVTPFQFPISMGSNNSLSKSPPIASAISYSPPSNWPLIGCPTSNWNIFDVQPLSKPLDLPPTSIGLFGIESNTTTKIRDIDSPTIEAATAPHETYLPSIRSQAMDVDRLRELIRPKPIPKSVFDATAYNIR